MCEGLESVNKDLRKNDAIWLTEKQRDIVKEVVFAEAERWGQKIYALAVCSNHVHLVAGSNLKQPEFMASQYKRVTSLKLRENRIEEKIWTRGYDKRFCFTQKDLQSRIKYVEGHNR